MARFVLIVAVVTLISFLTYFLTALAYGLASSYTRGMSKWGAAGIVLKTDANNNIGRSVMVESDFQSIQTAQPQDKARLGVSVGTLQADTPEDVTLFGVEPGTFVAPRATEGRSPTAANEIVASDELKASGLKLDDTVTFSGSDVAYKVVGFTESATFQASPIVYFGLDEWRNVTAALSGMTAMRDQSSFSAVVTKQQVTEYDQTRLAWQTIGDFSFTLPGYAAQVATFGMMVSFLIVISSFVIAIFTYILTVQKKSIFGVLKAEGVPNSYISRSVQSQVFILTGAGTAVGLLLTLAAGWGLGAQVPFLVQPWFFAGVTLLFLGCAALGGIASVRVVTKIDPVEAIG